MLITVMLQLGGVPVPIAGGVGLGLTFLAAFWLLAQVLVNRVEREWRLQLALYLGGLVIVLATQLHLLLAAHQLSPNEVGSVVLLGLFAQIAPLQRWGEQ